MKIIVGKTAGFCYGVKRAVEGTKQEIEQEKTIDCLGELIHNKNVMERLKKEGVNVVEKIEQVTGNVMIIRAHGTTKEVYQEAQKRGITIKDYTCPNVLKIHEIVEYYAKQGYYIFLLGTPNHPENIGTISYGGKNISVIENEEEIETELKKWKQSRTRKVFVVAQTTYSLEKFEKIQDRLRKRLPKTIQWESKNTICLATQLRQKETAEMAKQVDYMIIIGGKNSSNTKKLYEIAKQYAPNCIAIETAEELEENEIRQCKTVGIMAGASTPQEDIQKVKEMLEERCVR